MAVDRNFVNRKITLINADLKGLKALSKLSRKTYLSKMEYEVMAERYLERTIGRMIDINYHVLSETGEESPASFYDSFILMGRSKHLPLGLASRLAVSAGLRNRLAHEYDEINPDKVYDSVQDCLIDVPKYLKGIVKSLKL